VQRQYTGTTGKIDNCQLGAFLAYASNRGRALIDRELYLPASWTEDPDRCAAAGIPAECCAEGGFATKPQLGIAMLSRAYQAGVLTSGSWVTADEAYGQNPAVRDWLAARQIPFVLATRNDDVLTSPDGHRRPAKVLATLAGIGADGTAGGGWERRSVGPGAHGEREYDWTAVMLDNTGLPERWGHWLLVRRQVRPAEGKTMRDGVLPLRRPGGHTAVRVDPGGRGPLGDRGVLPDREERSRPGSLPGPHLAGLVCPHHPGSAGYSPNSSSPRPLPVRSGSALVTVAAPTPIPSPRLPLPPPRPLPAA
jgi:hypothetical protein